MIRVGTMPTSTEDMDPSGLRAAILPFLRATQDQAASTSAPAAAAPRPAATPNPLASTELFDAGAFRRALPKEEIASKMTAPPRLDAGRAAATPFGKETVALPSVTEPALAGLMPLERYAEITAQLQRENDPMKTFGRLGINPGEWMGTVRTWSKRFSADPSLERTFDALVKNLKNAR